MNVIIFYHHMTISKQFVTMEMLQTMRSETNLYSLQRFCKDPLYYWGTRKYYWLLFAGGFCKNAQPTILLGGKPQDLTGVSSVLSRNWFETLIQIIYVEDNLSVDDYKLRKIRSWLENLRQNFLKVSLK